MIILLWNSTMSLVGKNPSLSMRRNQYTMVPANFVIYLIPNTQYPRRSARVLGIYPNTYPVQNLGRVPPATYPPKCKTCRVHSPANYLSFFFSFLVH